MSGSMADIQSPTAEIRRGKKKEQTTGKKYICSALLHRADHKLATDKRDVTYRDGAGNITEDNSSVFSLIHMQYLNSLLKHISSRLPSIPPLNGSLQCTLILDFGAIYKLFT